MSKTINLLHVVFGTKNRLATINPSNARDLYFVLLDMLKQRDCFVYRINSMPDHVHLLFNLSPKQALSDVISDIKSRSSQWMSRSGLFPVFDGWARGYYACSVTPEEKGDVIEYIKSQQEHHKEVRFLEEMRWLYRRAGLSWHEDDMK